MLTTVIKDDTFSYSGQYNERLIDLKAEASEDSVCILTELRSIEYALKAGMPVVIYARDGYEAYPVYQNTYIAEELEDISDEYLLKIYNRHYGISNVIVTTDRLVVREIVLGDVKNLYKVYESEEVTRFVEKLYDYEEELEFTKAYIENMYAFYDYGLWIVEKKDTGELIGRAGLSNRLIDEEEHIELGYVIAREYQRQGYAYEASMAILQYAKNVLKKEEIIVCTDAMNLPSIKLAKKLGFDFKYEAQSDGKTLKVGTILLKDIQ